MTLARSQPNTELRSVTAVKNAAPFIDGESLNVSLCNANLSVDCGRALFKAFDYYIGLNRPLKLPF
jgi:hypothetical protein